MLPGLCLPPLGGASSALAGATWNPLDKSADITLSNSNLTATRPVDTGNFFAAVRATTSKTTGKPYFEITVNALTFNGGLNSIFVGASQGAQSLGLYIGQGSSYGWGNLGQIFHSGSNIGSMDTYSVGHVLAVAVDRDNLKIHFRNVTTGGNWNANAGHNPATNTGGFSTSTSLGAGVEAYPAASLRPINDAVTINCGSSPFVGAVPAGFSAWGA